MLGLLAPRQNDDILRHSAVPATPPHTPCSSLSLIYWPKQTQTPPFGTLKNVFVISTLALKKVNLSDNSCDITLHYKEILYEIE